MSKAIFAFLALLPASAWAETLYITDQNDRVLAMDSAEPGKMRQIEFGGQGPRGIAVSSDGAFLVTANQKSNDISIVDLNGKTPVRRVPIGPSTEMVRLSGHTAFVTYEPPDDKADNAHIAVVDIGGGRVIANITSGHETEGMEFSPDGRSLLVANEGDDVVRVYALPTLSLTHTIDTSAWGKRPRGIARLPDSKGYLVTLETSNTLIELNESFKFVRSVTTADGPYGVSLSPDGKRIFVAAARAGLLQVFDTSTLSPAGQVRLGKRCWHFSFAAGGKKVVAACGRSGAVYVVDAASLVPLDTILGMGVPWGIVAHPTENGSLSSTSP